MKVLFMLAIVILVFCGIALIISAFNGKYGDVFDGLMSGIECLFGAVFTFGFYILVDAAILYREKIEAEE